MRTFRFRVARVAAMTLLGVFVAVSARAHHQCDHNSELACSATVSASLSSADCLSPIDTYYDRWEIAGTAGQVITINMTSDAFDTYLILANPFDNFVAENDDFQGTNSRLTYTLTSTGTWRVYASSFDSLEIGSYSISLSCSTGTPTPPGPSDNVSYIPIAGHQPGANNTNFISDLRIVNLNAAADTVRLDFYSLSSAGVSGPSASSTLTVSPGEQAVLNDVVLTRFNTTGLGVIRISSAQPLEVFSRIINDQRPINGGTTGFAFRSKPPAQAKTGGVLPLLSSASGSDQAAGLGFRTNLGYFNPNTNAVTVTFTARRTFDGVAFGSNTVTIPALASGLSSIFNVISNVAAEDRVQPDYYVTYQASLPMFIYVSITDNKTGDGVLVD